MGAENPVTLCDLGIFADQAAEPVPAQNPDGCARASWMRTPGRRALLQCPVRPVRVHYFSGRPTCKQRSDLDFHVACMSVT